MVRVQIAEANSPDEIISALKGLESVSMVDFDKGTFNSFLVTSKENNSSRKDIFNLCVQKNWILTELTPIETKLEDIFRELTTN